MDKALVSGGFTQPPAALKHQLCPKLARRLELFAVPPATLRDTMAPSFDVERRRRKRIFNLLVVQSTPAFRLYMQECDSGAAPDLDPPDPWDSNISVRRWNWLMRQYDQAIKRFAANRVGC